MRKAMTEELAKYFTDKGFVTRSYYTSDPDAPFALRDIRREFKRFDVAVEEVKEYLADKSAQAASAKKAAEKQKEPVNGSK